MGIKKKPTYYWPIGEGEPPEGLKKKIEKMKKKKKKGYLGLPHKGETKLSTKLALIRGKGKKLAKSAIKSGIKYSPGTMGLKILSTAGKQFVKNIKNKKQTATNKKSVQQRLKKGGKVLKMNRGGRAKK